MTTKQTSYGWTYNKKGDIVSVQPPIHASGKVARKHMKTKTGGLLGGIGFGGTIGGNIR